MKFFSEQFGDIVEVIFVLFCSAEKHTKYLVSFDKKSKQTNYQKVALLKKLPSSKSWPGAFFSFFCKIQLSVMFLSLSLFLSFSLSLSSSLYFVFCCFFATQSCQFIMSFSREEVKTQNTKYVKTFSLLGYLLMTSHVLVSSFDYSWLALINEMSGLTETSKSAFLNFGIKSLIWTSLAWHGGLVLCSNQFWLIT